MIRFLGNSKKWFVKLGVKNVTIYLLKRIKNEKVAKYCILTESKNTYFECICATEAFYFLKCGFQSKIELI